MSMVCEQLTHQSFGGIDFIDFGQNLRGRYERSPKLVRCRCLDEKVIGVLSFTGALNQTFVFQCGLGHGPKIFAGVERLLSHRQRALKRHRTSQISGTNEFGGRGRQQETVEQCDGQLLAVVRRGIGQNPIRLKLSV